MVAVKFVYAWDVVVLAITVVVVQLFSVLSQRVTLPVIPDKVKVPELLPSQTVAALLKVPPFEAGSTEMVISLELSEVQPAEVTTALYWVFADKFK